MKTRHLIVLSLVFICILAFAVPSDAQRLEDQATTWADFNYVNYVASSMSHVYFATTQGIIRYNKLERRWEDPMTGQPGLDERDIRRVWVNTFDEKLYAETFSGLFEYDQLFESWSPITELPDIRSNTRPVSPPDQMFPPFGYTYSAGGVLIDPYGRSFAITDMIDDGAGTLWLGTWGNGAGTAAGVGDPIDLLPFGLVQNRVNAIYDDGEKLWLSGLVDTSYRAGISIFDVASNSFSYVEEGVRSDFPLVDIYCLDGDSEAVYIGTENGLMMYDLQKQRITDHLNTRNGLTDNIVLSLERVGDSLFVGTDGGLTLLDFAIDSVKYINSKEFLNQSIYSMAQQDTFLWIGASNGAYRYSLKTGKLQQYDDPKSVLFSHVYDIQVNGNEVWFVADGGVLMLDTKTGDTRDYQIISNRLWPSALAVNDEVAAVTSSRGMTLIFRNKYKPISREFSVEDGLPSPNVYSLLMDGDYVWVGTDLGLTHFYWNNPRRID